MHLKTNAFLACWQLCCPKWLKSTHANVFNKKERKKENLCKESNPTDSTRNQDNPHHLKKKKSCRGILRGYPLVRGYRNQLTYSFEHTARIFIEHKLNHRIERQIWQAKCISYLREGKRAVNQLVHQYYPDYFIRANCKLSLLASPRRQVTPSPSTAEGTPENRPTFYTRQRQ